jgi:hypothetical protein
MKNIPDATAKKSNKSPTPLLTGKTKPRPMKSVATHMTPISAISGAPDIDLDSLDVLFADAKRKRNSRFIQSAERITHRDAMQVTDGKTAGSADRTPWPVGPI